MRAIVIDSFGPPEVLVAREVPAPSPGDGEVLVAVRAAGVNPVDAGNRADGTWAGLRLPAILGSDFSGVIEAVGAGGEGWSPGDEVFGVSPFRGDRRGTYAELHVAGAGTSARKPSGLTHIEAAALPLAGTTAVLVLRRLGIVPDERVLVFGAGGGVGTILVQLLVARGARVVAVASARHHSLLRELGVNEAIDYADTDGFDGLEPFDAVADLVGGDRIASSLPLLREGGRAATIAGLAGDLDLAIDRNITLHGVLLDPADGSLIEELRRAVEDGHVRPIVTAVLPLEEAARAHRLLEAGHVQGKIVLDIPPVREG